MSAPQPPTSGDEPATGADATNGSATAPGPTQPKAAPRKAAPRKPAAAKPAAAKAAAGKAAATTSAAGAGAPRQRAPRTPTKTTPASAGTGETAETKVLPTIDDTEVLATTPAASPPATAETEVAPAVIPVEQVPEQPAEPAVEQSATEQPAQPAAAPSAQPASEQPTQAAPEHPFSSEPPAAHQAAPPARTITEVFAERLDNDGFFSALFDFTFTRYVTRKLAGPVYVVGLVLIGLSTILSLIYWLGQGIATHSFLGAFVFLFGLILTVVGSALAILLLRVAIEVFVAVVAIAENTRPRRKQDH